MSESNRKFHTVKKYLKVMVCIAQYMLNKQIYSYTSSEGILSREETYTLNV